MNKSFFLLTFVFSILGVACKSTSQTNNINVIDFEKAISQNDIQLLDVRTAGEFQTGHLVNSLQADWNNKKEFEERVKALDKSKPTYLYCLSGSRSNDAMNWLSSQGYKKVYNMKGGINAWKKAGKQVEKAKDIPQITLEEFHRSIPKEKKVLIDFSAVWCAPCKKMKPIVDSLLANNYNILTVDGGAQSTLSNQLDINAFPTFILYENGKETKRKQGLLTYAELEEMLK